jgi:hypothetical protein
MRVIDESTGIAASPRRINFVRPSFILFDLLAGSRSERGLYCILGVLLVQCFDFQRMQ